jgi:glycosyltransferase involved in cell wall biosynthesis
MRASAAGQDSVAILWDGLPHYAVAAIAAAIQHGPPNIIVLSTKPEVPVAGVEQALGGRIRWIERTASCSFRDLGEHVPAVTFTAGWSVPSFMRLARETRRAGGKVVCMCDNSFRGDLRQVAGAAVYRLKYSRFFDHVWVPGKSGTRLMRFFGVPANCISQGLYTADTTVFLRKTALCSRPLRYVFAGQFIERKNLLRMCAAFLQFRRQHSRPCELHLYGAGPLRSRIPEHPDIHVHGFATPSRLSAALNEARCLILPSVIDHWGVVVHEAAACGVLLIVSDAVGGAEDLCGPTNSSVIRATCEEDIVQAFQWAASLSQTDLTAASQESVERAAAFSVGKWAETFSSICAQLRAG